MNQKVQHFFRTQPKRNRMIKIIYKYLDIAGAEALLKNHTFKYCPIIELNDPCECFSFGINFDEKCIKKYLYFLKGKICNKVENDTEYLFSIAEIEELYNIMMENQLILNDIRDRLQNMRVRLTESFNNLCVLCLTSDIKNILMWSHYAEGQKGIAIGFEKDYFEDENSISKVRYRRTMPSLKTLMNSNINEYISATKKVMLTKAEEWSYEKELRRFQKKDSLEEIEINNNTLYLKEFPAEIIKEVIFGYRCPNEVINRIRSEYPLPSAKYYRMEYKKKVYGLEKIKL